ncbi:hypothetical protein V5799_023310 [Amblyomma americanum]|uniref:rRNA biogenesis protein RRP36 n=2 Tax=Amblyomma americanum TaxID=6943 RepID=A0AAQ4FJQ1_AMBAM
MAPVEGCIVLLKTTGCFAEENAGNTSSQEWTFQAASSLYFLGVLRAVHMQAYWRTAARRCEAAIEKPMHTRFHRENPSVSHLATYHQSLPVVASFGMASMALKKDTYDSSDSSSSSEDEHERGEKSEEDMSSSLPHMPFDAHQALKEKIGLKMYEEAVFGSDRRKSKQHFTRENKNRPREMSAKRQVPVFREVFQVKKKVHQDPRFSASTGEFDEKVFRESYSFINDIRAKERDEVAAMVRHEKDPQRRMTLQKLLKKMENQEATEKMKRVKANLDEQYSQFLASHRERKPIYLNKTTKRKIELAERFKQLKKAGKLEKYLEKKRKKNVQKERKRLPSSGT